MEWDARQSVVIIRALNPKSPICAEAVLVNALTTLGVREHPQAGVGYADFREALPDGAVRRVLRWTLMPKSRDGKYKTTDLIKWWNDPDWLAKNPTHELTVLRVGSTNLLKMIERIRQTPATHILRKGKHQLLLPANLSAEKREAALAKLHNLAA